MKTYEERTEDILKKRDEHNEKMTVLRRRLIPVIAVIVVMATLSAGLFIAFRSNETPEAPSPQNTVPADTSASTGPKEYNDGVIGENRASHNGGEEYIAGYSRDEMVKGGASLSIDRSEADAMWDVPSASPSESINLKAGTLSAGEWKDLDNFADWKNKFLSQEWSEVVKSRSLYAVNLIKVKVVDGESACFNCPVQLLSGDKTIFTARTDINGYAYLFYGIDGSSEKPDAVKISDKTLSLDGKDELTVEAAGAGIEAKKLDLMLMIDTTGSMGDELEYLKIELADMVSRIAKEDETLSIRVSVNFYRDEGDDYVVKYYDFREDINECLKQLEPEYAYGGGDYPEAVHTALENAVSGHQWRGDAVKLCFFVLDAPPHTENEIKGINENILKSLKIAAEQGIRIIPVASSGVDAETEILLRSFASVTGGTYIFLTNDSGIGGDHKEAEVGEHTTEFLNECMIRVVCEYCGIYHGEKVPYTKPFHQ